MAVGVGADLAMCGLQFWLGWREAQKCYGEFAKEFEWVGEGDFVMEREQERKSGSRIGMGEGSSWNGERVREEQQYGKLGRRRQFMEWSESKRGTAIWGMDGRRRLMIGGRGRE